MNMGLLWQNMYTLQDLGNLKNSCKTWCNIIKTSSADHTTLKLGCSNPLSLDVDDLPVI